MDNSMQYPTHDTQDFLFDLRGYLILRNAVDPGHIAALNAKLDEYSFDLQYGEWQGKVQRLDNNKGAGMELQNIVEGGEPFERLIDNPAWVNKLRKYCGEWGTYVDGLYIDECFASIRRQGGYFPFHSGGYEGIVRNQYRVVNGKFRCGQINILLALNDVGPGDGGTLVIPGSHKSEIPHPYTLKPWSERSEAEELEGAVEVHLKAGDALMFVDAIMHGASNRVNPGERRVVIYRYGPTWGNTRYGYQYSQELLDRLTPERRKILQPVAPRLAP
jgi:ectoine hydroxylase-related dioxygenase (phytanoyl-CoA dioxygenase family)